MLLQAFSALTEFPNALLALVSDNMRLASKKALRLINVAGQKCKAL